MNQPTARTRDGKIIKPSDAVLPILQKMPDKQLRVIGTAFYLTRYGLVVTAAHVIKELEEKPNQLAQAYIAHLAPENAVYLRKIVKAHYSTKADIAIFQADNYLKEFPDNPLSNMRPTLSFSLPKEGETLTTYGYPEMRI